MYIVLPVSYSLSYLTFLVSELWSILKFLTQKNLKLAIVLIQNWPNWSTQLLHNFFDVRHSNYHPFHQVVNPTRIFRTEPGRRHSDRSLMSVLTRRVTEDRYILHNQPHIRFVALTRQPIPRYHPQYHIQHPFKSLTWFSITKWRNTHDKQRFLLL